MTLTTAIAVTALLLNIALIYDKVTGARRAKEAAHMERLAADDVQSDRLLALKDSTIRELEDRLRRIECRITALESKLDVYGCWNAPDCPDRRPLSQSDPSIPRTKR